MRLKIVLADREPIGLALRRLRRLIHRNRPWYKVYKPPEWWHVPPFYIKPSTCRRAKRHARKVKARLGNLRARLLGRA